MNIQELTKSTLDSLKATINADTVVGEPIRADGALILPISKVSFGFVTGGGEYSESAPKVSDIMPYANAASGGATVSPIGFLVMKDDNIKFVKIEKAEDGKWGDLIQVGMKLLKK